MLIHVHIPRDNPKFHTIQSLRSSIARKSFVSFHNLDFPIHGKVEKTDEDEITIYGCSTSNKLCIQQVHIQYRTVPI
jgi:hypothetical protein